MGAGRDTGRGTGTVTGKGTDVCIYTHVCTHAHMYVYFYALLLLLLMILPDVHCPEAIEVGEDFFPIGKKTASGVFQIDGYAYAVSFT